jgi:hypothetical protein
LVEKARPRRIFLTSFTYDALWFESVLYPLLCANKCEQVALMVDARHAPSAINRAKTTYCGVGYRLMRVRPNHAQGLFHPKIAYLECKDQDVLIVGSGNLTNRGQGPALEVIDAVSSGKHPNVFGEFAGFLDRLPSAVKLLSRTDCAVLDELAARARTQQACFAAVASASTTAQLVTSLDASPLQQFAAAATRLGKSGRTLTVLSPFFDPGRHAVKTLAKEVSAEMTRYAVAPTSSGGYQAPFPKPAKSTSLEFVTPYGKDTAGRPLHAKWFEITDAASRSVTMTGSVNATQQSLAHQWNIEISLIRWLDAPTTAHWDAVADEDVTYDCIPEAEETQAKATHSWSADLDLVGNLRLSVYPALEAQPLTLKLNTEGTVWLETVESTGGTHVDTLVPTDVLGEIKTSTVWLDVEGATWAESLPINIAELLDQTPEELEERRTNYRLTHGKYFTPSDVSRVFSALEAYLSSFSAARAPRSPTNPGNGGGKASSSTRTTLHEKLRRQALRLLEYTPDELRARFERDEATDDAPEDNDSRDDKRPASRKQRGKKTGGGRPPAATSPDAVLQQRRLLMDAIEKLLKAGTLPIDVFTELAPGRVLEGLRRGCPRQTWAMDADPGLQGTVEADKSLSDISKPPSSYLLGQFRQVASWKLAEGGHRAYVQRVCWSAAFVAICLRRRGIAPPYGLIRWCLSRVIGSPLTSEMLVTHIREQCAMPYPAELPVIGEETLLLEVSSILNDKPEQNLFESLLHLAGTRPPITLPTPLLPYTPVVTALRDHRNKPVRFGWLRPEVLAGSRTCPSCTAPLSDATCTALWQRGASPCNCGRSVPLFLASDEDLCEWLRTEQRATSLPLKSGLEHMER